MRHARPFLYRDALFEAAISHALSRRSCAKPDLPWNNDSLIDAHRYEQIEVWCFAISPDDLRPTRGAACILDARVQQRFERPSEFNRRRVW